jgi:hypothetical protein
MHNHDGRPPGVRGFPGERRRKLLSPKTRRRSPHSATDGISSDLIDRTENILSFVVHDTGAMTENHPNGWIGVIRPRLARKPSSITRSPRSS